MCRVQGYEGERIPDPNSKRIAQAKLGLDRNANKKKKKKKVAVVEDGPSKAAHLLHIFLNTRFMWYDDKKCVFLQKKREHVVILCSLLST